MNCNCDKKTIRDQELKNIYLNHLSRIEGQVKGIKKMVESDRYCVDILIQLSAIEKSIKSLSSEILNKHLNTCVKDAVENGDKKIIDEILNLFKRYK